MAHQHQHNNDVLLAWLTSALFRPCARPALSRSIFALPRHSSPAASPISVVPSVLAQTRHALAKTRGAKRGLVAPGIHQTLMNNARTRRRGKYRHGHGWMPADGQQQNEWVGCLCRCHNGRRRCA
ncbi:hypothetical protein niasHS_005263 [Heterodera schachtii]|uniref:Uncharacterized protein n=1 Tax=Heterodera schachtii TaxID=97005 RepID=A0ABD2J8Y9_HETSC